MYVWRTDPRKELDEAAAEASWEHESPSIFDLIDQHIVKLDVAIVDFDNDGNKDRVYRYLHPIKFPVGNSANESLSGYWYFLHQQSRQADFRRFST